MPSKIRRKNSTLIERLLERPGDYSFFQAVRLLERLARIEPVNQHEADAANSEQSEIDATPSLVTTALGQSLSEQPARKIKKAKSNHQGGQFSGNPVARFTPPSTEAMRFHTRQTLSFSPSEIDKISLETKDIEGHSVKQWHLLLNFMGLTGTQGVLPYHYTELILQRLKLKDESLKRFFDLFNHRTISLFYQAGIKYRLPVEYERKKLNPPAVAQRDSSTQALLSLIGMGTKHLTNRLYTKDESLLYYSGILTQKIRTASGLRQMIQRHFDIPVKIQEFVGQWQELIDDVRSRFSTRDEPSGQNISLGKSVMLGKKGWFAQGKVRIILGPLNREQAQKFAPSTKALYAINEIVKMYVGMEYDYDFIVRVKRRETLDKAQLGSNNPPLIGWNTWLVSQSKQHYQEDETLDIAISAKQFQ